MTDTTRQIIRMIDFKVRGDERGSLIALESGSTVPFDIRRVYYIFGTRAGVQRGFHAHRSLKQLVVAVSGTCLFQVDDGRHRHSFRLDSPAQGLLVEGLIWREMSDFSEDCVLMVLADQHYDESDYIRNYDEFLEALKR